MYHQTAGAAVVELSTVAGKMLMMIDVIHVHDVYGYSRKQNKTNNL
jgi:hypothetical protein